MRRARREGILLVQLEVLGESDRLAVRLISEHFGDLQQHKLPHLSKQIGIDVETLLEELQFIRTLDPYPGRRYSSEEPILISPEIYIEKLDENDDEYVIYFADDGSRAAREPAVSADAEPGRQQRDEEFYSREDAFGSGSAAQYRTPATDDLQSRGVDRAASERVWTTECNTSSR